MIEKKTAGSTGVAVSVVGIGGWQMGGPEAEGEQSVGHGWGGVEDRESIRIIHRAEELGVNLIDTADIYGNGHSEEVIGKALKGRRERWVVATKGGLIKKHGERGQYADVSAAHILQACEMSLRRLQTECIDFYQLHASANAGQAEETMHALAELKAAGKIRFAGISTDSTEDVRILLAYGCIDIVQLATSLFENEHECLQFCHANGIGTFIRTPLRWGAVFGKYAQGPLLFETGDMRAKWDAEEIRKKHQRGLHYQFLWEGTSRTPAQAALRAVLDKPGVTAVIPGIRKMEHLLDNVGAAAVPSLSEEEKSRVWNINQEMSH